MKPPWGFPACGTLQACPPSRVPSGQMHLPHRSRPVDILFQFALQPIQLLIQLRGKFLQSLPIYAPTPPVGPDTFPGHLQVLPLVHLVD
jgi:hypothetical protein